MEFFLYPLFLQEVSILNEDKKLVTFEQMQLQTQRLKSAIDSSGSTLSFVETLNGIEIKNDSGTTIYKIPIMQESD